MLTPKQYSKINIEISNICNLQCSFCPEVIRSPKLMDLQLFENIIEQVAPITEQVCFHLMGDPLVHPHLELMIEICHRYQVRIFFVTNGVLLRDKQSQLLLHPAFRQVNFSLHSFSDNYPEKDPTSYLQRIFAYTDRAIQERPDLYINYRLWNLDDPRGTSSKNQSMLDAVSKHFSFSAQRQLDVREQKSWHIQNRLYLHFDTEFTWPNLDLPILGTSGRCYGLKSHFGILVDGTVVPCCLDKEAAISLGKIQETPLQDILNSSRAQKLIIGFRAQKLVEDLCQRCQYIERFQ